MTCCRIRSHIFIIFYFIYLFIYLYFSYISLTSKAKKNKKYPYSSHFDTILNVDNNPWATFFSKNNLTASLEIKSLKDSSLVDNLVTIIYIVFGE